MTLEEQLKDRSDCSCELCNAKEDLSIHEVLPKTGQEASILICATCLNLIQNPETEKVNHWRCLNDSMWSTIPAVQVQIWRILNDLKSEGWTQDLLDMMYLEEGALDWAKAEESEQSVVHLDSNGAVLSEGDTVTLIKDLNVKGANFVAKRGTAVRRISLVTDNAEHIEGKLDGQRIVILTKYVKKAK